MHDRKAFVAFCNSTAALLIKGRPLDDRVFDYLLGEFDALADPDDRELLAAMRLLKAYHKRIEQRYFDLSLRLLDLVRENRLKHRYYDAIIYFGKAVLALHDPQKMLELVDNQAAGFDDPFAQRLFSLLRGFGHYAAGDFDCYEAIIRDVKAHEPAGDYYIFKPLSTSLDRALGGAPPPPVQPVFEPRDPPVSPDARLVICTSCDEAYFARYHRFIIDSFRAAAPPDSRTILHVGLISDDPDRTLGQAGLTAPLPENVIISPLSAPDAAHRGPLASLLRLVDAHHLAQRLGCDLATVDFDAFFHRIPDLSELDCDMGLRILRGVLPWETYAAGFSWFPASGQAHRALEIMFEFANLYYDPALEQWWIDQNALEAAVRTLTREGRRPGLADVRTVIVDDITLPTGATDAKLRLLEEAYSRLPPEFRTGKR